MLHDAQPRTPNSPLPSTVPPDIGSPPTVVDKTTERVHISKSLSGLLCDDVHIAHAHNCSSTSGSQEFHQLCEEVSYIYNFTVLILNYSESSD